MEQLEPAFDVELDFEVHDEPPARLQKYDMCLVFPVNTQTNRLRKIGQDIVRRIIKIVGSKYVYAFYSEDSSCAYILLRVSMKLLKTFAEDNAYELLLDRDEARERARLGDAENCVLPVVIPHLPEVSRYDPFDFIYAPYLALPEVQDLYYRPEEMSHPFRRSVRVKILIEVFANSSSKGEDWYELDLEYLRRGKVITCYFPIQDAASLQQLHEEWLTVHCCGMFGASFIPWYQPFHEIREYCGEKLGFYFAFLGFIAQWLWFPAFLGIAIQGVALYFSAFSRYEIPIFALIFCLWALIAMHAWGRVSQLLAMKWNMWGYRLRQHHKMDRVRYQFYGLSISSPIDGSETIIFRTARRRGLYFISILFMLFYITLLLTCVAAILYFQHRILHSPTNNGSTADILKNYDRWIISLLFSIQIAVSNRFSYAFSWRLSSWENHRTDADYDFAFTVKLAILLFVGTFASFYYIAFVAKYMPDSNYYTRTIHGCGPGSCLTSLTVHFVVVLTSQVLLHSITRNWGLTFCHLFCCFKDGSHDEHMEAYPTWNESASISQSARAANYSVEPDAVESTVRSKSKKDHKDAVLALAGRDVSVESSRSRKLQQQKSLRADEDFAPESQSKRISEDCSSHDDDATPPTDQELEHDNAMEDVEQRERESLSEGNHIEAQITELYPEEMDARSYTTPLRSTGPLLASASRSQYLDPPEDIREGRNLERSFIDTERSHNEDQNYYKSKAFAGAELSLFHREVAYDQNHHLRIDYMRSSLWLGLVLSFISALPAAGGILFLAIAIEVRSKAWQFIYIYRRPVPIEVEGIGNIHGVVKLYMGIAIVTNACLVSFNLHNFEHWSVLQKTGLAIGFIFVCMVFQIIVSIFITSVPAEVMIQQERAAVLRDKLIHRVPEHAVNAISTTAVELL